MTVPQQIITVGLCVLGTMLTRFLPFSSSGRIKNADFHPVHWEVSPFCSFRHARHLLPEKCQLSERKPRSPGAARDHSHHRPPSLETPDAFLNLRRDDLLYAAASVCILRYHWTKKL